MSRKKLNQENIPVAGRPIHNDEAADGTRKNDMNHEKQLNGNTIPEQRSPNEKPDSLQKFESKKAAVSHAKRILMSALGVIICGISVGMFKYASLGVDPFQSFMSGLDAVIPIRFGTLYVIVNLLLLTFALIFDRRKIGLATLINLFLLGYIAEFSQRICHILFPETGIAGRFVLLLVAIGIMCLASAFYFTADLGVSTYDAVSLIWSEKQSRIRFQYCRILCDLICVCAGALLCKIGGINIFGEVNIGTIITAFFMGPLIAFFNEKVARPFLYGRAEQ